MSRSTTALGLAFLTQATMAQTGLTLPAVKATMPIKCDCQIGAPCWKTAPLLTGFVDINHGNPVADQTVAHVLYDEKNVYVLVECRDAHPEAVVGRETVRDSLFAQNNNSYFPTNEDYVMVTLDPFQSHQSADIDKFGVNPLGTPSAQVAGGRAAKAEWNGDWETAAKKTADGWICQFRIPWNMIHYPPGGRTVNIGLDVARFNYRTQTMSSWNNLGPQLYFDREGQWTGVELPKGEFKHTLSLLPYARGGLVDGQLAGKTGLDARYLVTPDLTAVGTVNPDFSTIEGAIQSIQFSHSERFLPDYRPFFTEGGDTMFAQINYNDIGAFFYPRRISTFNAGAKVYGKFTPNDSIGALAIQGPEGRNDVAARFKHTFSPTSYGSAIVVGTNSGGGQSTVGEADQHMRFGKLGVEGEFANATGPGAGGGAQFVSTYYADRNLTSCIQGSEISSNFIAPDGFFPYVGYKGLTAFEDYSDTWRHGMWRGFDLTVVYIEWLTLAGGGYFNGVQGSASIETRSDFHLEFDYASDSQFGTDDNTLGVNLLYGATNRFRQFGVQAITGETGGVHSTFLSPTASVRVFKSFDLIYGGGIQNRAGLTQQHILTANYQISPTRSFGGRVVVANADTNVYLFYHNSGGKGTEYYLLFGDPNATRTVHAIQAKVVFALGTK